MICDTGGTVEELVDVEVVGGTVVAAGSVVDVVVVVLGAWGVVVDGPAAMGTITPPDEPPKKPRASCPVED